MSEVPPVTQSRRNGGLHFPDAHVEVLWLAAEHPARRSSLPVAAADNGPGRVDSVDVPLTLPAKAVRRLVVGRPDGAAEQDQDADDDDEAAHPQDGSPAREVRAVEDLLLTWFAEHGRDLPWRRTRDPYAILVSEVMSQQTQVERVAPRWQRWLDRWPTVDALAAALAADVIREWQGLGYNRRALSLHRTAQQVAAHGWPNDLTELPGVGRYTADAVSCFAFGRPVLPVDVNVRRVSERTGHPSPPLPRRR